MNEILLKKTIMAAHRFIIFLTSLSFIFSTPQSAQAANDFISFYPSIEERTLTPPHIRSLSVLCRQKRFMGRHITFVGDSDKKAILYVVSDNAVEDLSKVISLRQRFVQFYEDHPPSPSVIISPEATMDWAYIFDRNTDGKIDYVAYFFAVLSLKPDDFPPDYPQSDAVLQDDGLTLVHQTVEQYNYRANESRLFFQHHADDNFDGTSDAMVAAVLDPYRYPWVEQFGVLRSKEFSGTVDETWTFKKDILQKTGIVESVDNKYMLQNAPGLPLLTGKESLDAGTGFFKSINKFAKKCGFSGDSFLQTSNISIFDASYSGNLKRVKELLERGEDVNSTDNNGSTPLLLASASGHSDIVEILIANGAEINFKGSTGYTPLLWASLGGYEKVVKILLESGADIHIASDKEFTPLFAAVVKGNPEVVKILINSGADVNKISDMDEKNLSPLLQASATGVVQTVKLLLEAGADVNFTNNNGYTPLLNSVSKGYIEVAKILIDAGADVDAKRNNGYSSLVFACRKGFFDIAKLLVEKGANVNSRDENKFTPIMHAAYHGHTDIVKLLLDNGADVNADTGDGRTTALGFAITMDRKDTVRILKEAGATLKSK